MTLNVLKSTAAILALTTGMAFAASDTQIEAETKTDVEVAAEQTGEFIKKTTEDAANATADMAGDAAQATKDAAEATVTTAGEVADDAAQATKDAVSSAAAATEEAVKDTGQAIENAAASVNADVTVSQPSEFAEMTVGEIIGQNVYGANGEDVGEVDYIFRDGDMLMAIVGVGGFLGLGEHDVAIPLSDFELAQGDLDGLVLNNWDEEELRNAPEFDESTIEALEADVRIGDAL